jgi:trimeric autotransporter adhesin
LEVKANGTRALRIEPNPNNAPNVIGGSSANFVDSGIVGATIGGGGTTSTNYYLGSTSNRVAAIFGTIAGGRGQTVAGDHAFIGGGINNAIQTGAFDSVIGGGVANIIQTNAAESVIAGGIYNFIQPFGSYSFIGGGAGNSIQFNAYYSVLGGGSGNSIQTNANNSVLGGGNGNSIRTGAPYSFIGGGNANTIQPGAFNSVIGGGLNNSVQTNSPYSMIAGGRNNSIRSNALYASIGGGSNNIVQTNASYAFIGGGVSNVAGGVYSTVAGGGYNTSSGWSSFVGGGGGYNFLAQGPYPNTASGDWSFIGGGFSHVASGFSSTIGGGGVNLASGYYATIGGGEGNRATNNATVGGGVLNIASGYSSTIPGGYVNVASGAFSFAAGQNASALHDGSFVWADSSSTYTFASTANDQFAVRAHGGMRLEGNLTLEGGSDGAYRRLELSGGNSLGFLYGSYPYFLDGVHLGYNFYADSAGSPHVINAGGGTSRVTAGYGEVVIGVGSPGFGPNQIRVDVTTAGVTLNGTVTVNGTFVNNSDRNAKQNFTPINSNDMLEKVTRLPISQWNYKEEASSVQHIGPMAQDFYTIFNIGLDDKHIAPIDEGGVALAAIQGLNEKVESGKQKAESRIEKLEAENGELKKEMAELKKLVSQFVFINSPSNRSTNKESHASITPFHSNSSPRKP